MVNPTNCPSDWEHNPATVSVKSWSDIPVHNVWRNKKTGEVLIHFSTITTVTNNKYVESHPDPGTVESRLRKLKDAISRDDVETEIDKVTVTGGKGIVKCSSNRDAEQKAVEYMRGNIDSYYGHI